MSDTPPEVTQTESRDAGSAHGKGRSLWLLWVILPMIYILSVGPAVKFIPSNGKFMDVVETFYTPLLVYAVKCKPVHAFLRWYVEDAWHCKGCVGTLASRTEFPTSTSLLHS